MVLGRSKIVGAPMAALLTWNHATVTVCHSRTQNIEQVVSGNDTGGNWGEPRVRQKLRPSPSSNTLQITKKQFLDVGQKQRTLEVSQLIDTP